MLLRRNENLEKEVDSLRKKLAIETERSSRAEGAETTLKKEVERLRKEEERHREAAHQRDEALGRESQLREDIEYLVTTKEGVEEELEELRQVVESERHARHQEELKSRKCSSAVSQR